MLKDELFERFPCDTVFGMHNHPGHAGRQVRDPARHHDGGRGVLRHPRRRASARTARGRRRASIRCWSPATSPRALQAIVSRNVKRARHRGRERHGDHGGRRLQRDPADRATCAAPCAPSAHETMTLIETNMKRIVAGVAAAFGATAEVDFRVLFAPLVNEPAETALYRRRRGRAGRRGERRPRRAS